jgi:hypothetical protein
LGKYANINSEIEKEEKMLLNQINILQKNEIKNHDQNRNLQLKFSSGGTSLKNITASI